MLPKSRFFNQHHDGKPQTVQRIEEICWGCTRDWYHGCYVLFEAQPHVLWDVSWSGHYQEEFLDENSMNQKMWKWSMILDSQGQRTLKAKTQVFSRGSCWWLFPRGSIVKTAPRVLQSQTTKSPSQVSVRRCLSLGTCLKDFFGSTRVH